MMFSGIFNANPRYLSISESDNNVYIKDNKFVRELMKTGVSFDIKYIIKEYKQYVRSYKNYEDYGDDILDFYSNTDLYFKGNNKLTLSMIDYDFNEGNNYVFSFYVNDEKMNVNMLYNYYGDEKITPLNIKHHFKRKDWRRNFYCDGMSIKDISMLYFENCKLAVSNNKNKDEVVNTVMLDNGKSLKFDINVSDEDFSKGNFSYKDMIIRIFDYNEVYDWLVGFEYLKEVKSGVYRFFKFNNFFNYDVSRDFVRKMIDNKDILCTSSNEQFTLNDKINELKKIKSIINSLFYNIENSREDNSFVKDQIIFSDWRINISEDILIYNNEYGYREIRDEFKDNLKYFNLDNIDWDNVDIRGINFSFSNPSKLNLNTVYSYNDETILPFSDEKIVKVKKC